MLPLMHVLCTGKRWALKAGKGQQKVVTSQAAHRGDFVASALLTSMYICFHDAWRVQLSWLILAKKHESSSAG